MSTRLNKWIDDARALVTGIPAYERRFQKLFRSIGDPKPPEYDLVYVMPPKHVQGWILDAICREIDQHVDARTAFVEFNRKLPPARAYFYAHYGYLRDTINRQPEVLHARNLLFYTHPRKMWYPDAELMHVLNMADSVVSMCSMFAQQLVADGVREELVEVALVGADADLFQPHTRGTGKIGFCSGYLPRKGGDRILELVRSMPGHEFVLCGKKWPDWDRFAELRALPNLEYVDVPYDQYPEFYEAIDVFVSVSELEGGPVPLIESAMCNVVPVCSNTGHAADIISHGENGFLFDTSAPIGEIQSLIEKAFTCTCDVRSTVEHLTWKRFSHQVQEIAGMRPRVSETRSAIAGAA